MTMPVIPPDDRAVGTGNPAIDFDQLDDSVAFLTELMAGFAGFPARPYPANNSANLSSAWSLRAGRAVMPGLPPTNDPTGTDDTGNLSTIIAAGDPVLLHPGATYTINAPLPPLPSGYLFDGRHGGHGTSAPPAVIKLASTYSSSISPINFVSGSADHEIKNLSLDATAVPSGTCVAIEANTAAPVNYVKLRRILIVGAGFTNGIHGLNVGGNLLGWDVERVTVRGSSATGYLLVGMTDGYWDLLQAASCGTHGFSIQGCSSSLFRLKANQNANNGVSISGSAWGTGAGSGGAVFWITTDRNTQSGVNISSTGNGPLLFPSLNLRRDGADGNTGRAALLISAGTTNPVAVGNIGVYPGVNDDGTGSVGPPIGVSVASVASQVHVASGYIHALTSPLANSGKNPNFTVAPDVVQVTGASTAPVPLLQPSPGWTETPQDHGYAGWTYSPTPFAQAISGTALPTAGVISLWKIPIRVPIPVTTLRLYLTALGASLTSGQNFAGLISATGAQIATSADQTTAWNTGGTTGVLDITMTGSPFLATPPFIWGATVWNGTTGPSFARTNLLSNSLANGTLPVAVARYGTILTGQTAIPSSITPGSIALAATQYWAAVW